MLWKKVSKNVEEETNKKEVKNNDLWKQLDQLAQQHQIEWFWVRGHSGHDGNEQADKLANQGAESIIRE